MKLWSSAFKHGDRIPAEFAFGQRGADGRFAPSDNRSPPLSWSELPAGTRSLVVVCHDTDVPTRADDVNQEGRRVPTDLPRAEFFHGVLTDIDAASTGLPAGAGGSGIVARGKPGPASAHGRHAINDFSAWFAGDEAMKGDYFGYDGPCPPWNDTIVHHYWFTLYALDVAAPSTGALDARSVLAAITPHVLDKATLMGTYTIADDAVDLAAR